MSGDSNGKTVEPRAHRPSDWRPCRAWCYRGIYQCSEGSFEKPSSRNTVAADNRQVQSDPYRGVPEGDQVGGNYADRLARHGHVQERTQTRGRGQKSTRRAGKPCAHPLTCSSYLDRQSRRAGIESHCLGVGSETTRVGPDGPSRLHTNSDGNTCLENHRKPYARGLHLIAPDSIIDSLEITSQPAPRPPKVSFLKPSKESVICSSGESSTLAAQRSSRKVPLVESRVETLCWWQYSIRS